METYTEQRGWGLVKPVIDVKLIAPLCRHPYHGHPKGCKYGCRKKFYYDVVDPDQDIFALYFSMDLRPLYEKMQQEHPEWTIWQVRNIRYWTATKKRLQRDLFREFIEVKGINWARVLNRNPDRINYTFGIHYDATMEQIGIDLQWPPEPFPLTIEFVGRPVRELDPMFMIDDVL